MKYRIYACCLLTLIAATAVRAINRVSVADVWGTRGSSIELPVSMDNDCEVVAIQFTMTVPEGVSIDVNHVTRSSRMTDHAVTVSKVATGRYMVTVMSAANTPFKASSGELLTLYLNIGSNLSNGYSSLLPLSEVVMSLRTGENVVNSVVHGTLTVDDAAPKPELTASKTDIHEGEAIQLTMTTAHPVRRATTFSLTAEHPARFSLPSSVTIPTGSRTATVEVTAIDDDMPSLDLPTSFIAYAEGYERAEALVMLHDDDLPLLELELTPSQVKEDDGPVSVTGTLRRTTNTDSRIIVRLSDDSHGGLYLGQTQIELAKGQQEVHFSLGPVDNGNVDGDREYTVTAAVWLSSCSCSATGQAAGSVEARLKVYDDDGPSLTLTTRQSALFEGGTTALTVSRNTPATAPLIVGLASTHNALLSYTPSVTISAGQQQATVEVSALSNDTQGDTQTIQFTAQAEGHSPGTCLLLLTDQTLPDATVGSIEMDKEEEMAGGSVTLTVTVANAGNAPLSDATPVFIYRRGSSTAVAMLYTQMILEPGGQETMTRSITLPATTGNQAYYAVVNGDRRVNELTTCNNTSGEVVVSVMPPFTAKVQTDKATYQAGEKVVVSGQLEGKRTILTEAELYIIGNGTRQNFTITTDEEGHFNYEWFPYALEMGHYDLGVCYPGEGLRQTMAAVDIIGMRRQGSGYITCDVTQGEPYQGDIMIENPGTLRLSGVKAEVLSAPQGCDVELSLPSAINGGAAVQLHYTIKGSMPTPQNEWERIVIRVTTTEKAVLEQTLYYYCRSAKAKLVVSETAINTTVTKGNSRDYILYITNQGRGSTGTVSMSLPEWMKPVTGTTLSSLAQNDTAVVMLRLQPTADMQLNVPQTGYFGINCQNGSGVRIDYSVTPVSDSKGRLIVDVLDENSYYQNGPHLSSAQVVVRNPVTSALVAQGMTDSQGLFTQSLPEGWYQLSVTADGHDSYQNNILIAPGVENRKTVNLSINGISVSWDVEKTEVEDEYEIVTNVTYETNVPVPVVVLDIPKRIAADSLQDGQSLIFYAKLTNVGLIKANDVSLLLPTGFSRLSFEPLADYQLMTLEAGQSVTIPVKVTRANVATSRPRHEKPIDNDPCVAQPGTLYFWDCGTDRKWHRYSVALQLGSCDSNDPSTWYPESNPTGGEPRVGGGWPIVGVPDSPNLPGGNTSGGGYVSSTTKNYSISSYEDKGCEPCQNVFLLDLLKCIPVLGNIIETVENVGSDIRDANLCLRAAYRDNIELKEKLQLCPFTDNLVAIADVLESLCRVTSGLATGEYGEDDLSTLNAYVDAALDSIGNSLKEEAKAALEKEIGDVGEELIVEYLDQKYPGFRKAKEKAEELKQKIETIIGKSNDVIENAEKLSQKDRADIGGVLKCTCELTGAIGSLLEELPATKDFGKTMGQVAKQVVKLKCWLDLVNYKCDKEGTQSRGIIKRNATGNSAIDAFIEALSAYTSIIEAGDAIVEEVFGDAVWMDVPQGELAPLYYYLTQNNSNGSGMLRYILKPQNITFEQFDIFVERWRKIFYTVDGYQGLLNLDRVREQMDIIDKAEAYLSQSGFDDFSELLQARYQSVMDDYASSSVCARVSLALPETLQLTRQAFRGTLTVFNGHENTAMEDLKLTLLISSDNQIATQHEFQMNVEQLTGFEGTADLASGWRLDAQQTGMATIMFIPTQYAAPTGPTEWSFGGVLSYIDPFTGNEVRRELYPITLTVQPSPLLDLDYFMQRDVYGDDPLTTDSIEPVVPAEFALIINNKGAGEARNVRLTTRQPQIVDNEKGLAVDFRIVGTSLNGEARSLVMSDSYATNFGTIGAGEQSYAQWWLTSSLLGHFTSYDVTVNHVTSHDNPDLSLIDQARIHELIHGFSVVADEHGQARRGFLVNDMVDANDLPDRIYFTDAALADVHMAQGTVSTQGGQYVLTMTPLQAGWNYGSVADPTGGTLAVAEVTRQSDGATMPTDNVWQTSRTLRDGQDWRYENRLHFVALLPEGGDSYLLSFRTHEEVGIDALALDCDTPRQLHVAMRGDWLTVTGEDYSYLQRLELYDLRGMKRLDIQNVTPGQALYVGQLPAGVYQVVVTTGDGRKKRTKVMKRK